MLGMHGTYEANLAMNQADLIVALGARFDDRVTGRLDAFSAEQRARSTSISTARASTRPCASTCRSSPMSATRWRTWSRVWKARQHPKPDTRRMVAPDRWLARDASCLDFPTSDDEIMPQRAIRALCEATHRPRADHHHRSRPAPDVGRAAFRLRGAEQVADQRRARHDGLWPARRDRRAARQPQRAGASTSPAKRRSR